MKKLILNMAYVWGVLALILLVAGFVTFINNNFDKVGYALSQIKNDTAQVAVVADVAKNKLTLDDKISNVLLEKKDSVVYIEIGFKEEYQEAAQERGLPGGGNGTGWFVEVNDEFAYVVTNHHVIESYLEVPQYLEIGVFDLGTPWYNAVEVVGYDKISDIAVLKVANYPNSGWKALTWAEHGNLEEGDHVVIIGHGLGLPWSMSSGIITALDRWQIRRMNLMIQSDAVVNPGNSGGPMFNLDGEVIGVVDAILDPSGQGDDRAYAGVSLGIAGFQAQKAVNEIIANGQVTYPFVDFEMRNPTREEYTEAFGHSKAGSLVIVDDISENTNASVSNLQPGDFIMEVDGKKLDGMISMLKVVLHRKPGDILELTVLRDGELITTPYMLNDYKYFYSSEE